MANRSLGSLTLNLVAEIGGYVGPLSKAERATAASAARMKKDIEQVAKAGTLFAVGVGTAFAALVKHSIDLQDEMSKASQKIGVSVGDLSKLNYAADLSGVAFESLVSALGKFNKNLAEAYTSGTGAAADALADLGIKTEDSAGKLKSTNDVFLEVADRLSGLQDGAVKTSLAMDLFGKSGADLIPLLNSGKAGLADMASEAEKLGQVLDADAAKKAEEFNDNLTRLQKTFTGVANSVAMDLLPQLTDFSEKIKDPAFQEGISSLAQGLVSITGNIVSAASSFGNFSKFLGQQFASTINGIASDDIPRLEARLLELQKALAPQNNSNNILTGVKVTDVLKSTEELEKERDEILKNIAAYNKYQEQKAKAAIAAPKVTEDSDPFKLTDEQVKASRELREQQKKAAEEAATQAKQLQKTFADSLANLQREIDLYNQVSKTSELRYETEKGNLKNLSDAQKEQLLNLAKIADMRERDQALLESQRAVDLAQMGENGQLESIQYEYDLKKGIIQLNETINGQDREKLINNKKLVEQFAQQAQTADLIKQQQRSIDLAGKTSKAAQTEYDIRNGILKVYGGINSEQAKVLIDQAKILDSQEAFQEASKLSAKAFERIEEAGANVWLNMEDGFEGFRDSVLDSFKRLLAEMAHEAITKPILLQIQQSVTGGAQADNIVAGAAQGASSGGGILGSAGGVYAAAALVTIAAIDKWNAKQDEKFLKLTAEYKQANQSLSAVLGEGNRKSQAIATGIDSLSKSDSNLLDVNNKMLVSLEGIRAGISNVAAGFAKTLVGSNDYEALGIKQGTTTSPILDKTLKGFGIPSVIDDLTGGFIGDFLDGVVGSISKAIYSKKKKVIDSGIQIVGTSLADILTGASIQAFNYADVKTTKKVFGVTTSAKTKRSREDLNNVFEQQITGVFKDAADALRDASGAFGIDFNQYVNELKINAQDISLKGLEGDALTKELESFFSKTLDDWAGALLGAGNTRILEDFQEVGESAFQTVLRLASETRTFGKYAEVLQLNFKAAGIDAVYATQAIADAAGGFDRLSNSLATYYDKFFSESDKFAQNQKALAEAFKGLNVALPSTREGFKQLISGLDLTNAADQERFAQLIKLSGATDEYFNALEKETQARKDAVKAAATNSFDAFTKAVDKQKTAVQKQIDAANEALGSTKAVTDSLNSALKSMTLQSSKNELAVRRQAQAQIIAANAIAKAGGPLPKAGQLDDALSVLSQPSQDLYASFEDYARDFYTTSKNIKELADASGAQQTFEEQNIEVLNSQLSALDDMVKFYQSQIDKLDDVNTSVLSVRTAIDQLNNTLAEAGINVNAPMAAPELSYAYEQGQITQSQDYTLNTPTLSTTNVSELIDRIDQLTEQLEASQFAIAKNTLNTAKILQRWDADGMPSETSSV